MKFTTNLVSQVKIFAVFSFFIFALSSVNVSASPTKEFASGETSVSLSPELIQAAGSLNLSVNAVNPARRFGAAGFSFPITSGLVDLQNAKGEIIHGGGLRLAAGGTTVDLRNFIIDTTGAQPVLTGVAVVNNSFVGRIPLFKLTLPALQLPLSNRTFVLNIPNVDLKLTAQAAAALNQSFGISAFVENFPIGKAQVRAISFEFPTFPGFNFRDAPESVQGETTEIKENNDQK